MKCWHSDIDGDGHEWRGSPQCPPKPVIPYTRWLHGEASPEESESDAR